MNRHRKKWQTELIFLKNDFTTLYLFDTFLQTNLEGECYNLSYVSPEIFLTKIFRFVKKCLFGIQFCHDKINNFMEESIYNIIPKNEEISYKKPIYRSKYPHNIPPTASTFGHQTTSRPGVSSYYTIDLKSFWRFPYWS